MCTVQGSAVRSTQISIESHGNGKDGGIRKKKEVLLSVVTVGMNTQQQDQRVKESSSAVGTAASLICMRTRHNYRAVSFILNIVKSVRSILSQEEVMQPFALMPA